MVTCPDPFIIDERSLKNQKIEKSNTQKVEKRQKIRKMKFCRECATGNQGENCPTACKGDQQSCACLNDGCCKPGIFSFALVWDIHGPDMVGPMPGPVPTQSQRYADFQQSRKPSRRLFSRSPQTLILIRSPTRTILSASLSPNPWNRLYEFRITNNSVCEPCVGCSTGCSCADGECFCANK